MFTYIYVFLNAFICSSHKTKTKMMEESTSSAIPPADYNNKNTFNRGTLFCGNFV